MDLSASKDEREKALNFKEIRRQLVKAKCAAYMERQLQENILLVIMWLLGFFKSKLDKAFAYKAENKIHYTVFRIMS